MKNAKIVPISKPVNTGLRWSDHDDSVLLDLDAQHYPAEAIAAQLRRRTDEIVERLKALKPSSKGN